VQLPYEQLRCFQLAYAVTVHRAQGCEMPACVLALDRSSTFRGLMTRPMLYTGLTRARELAVIVGQGQAIADCVARAATERRHSLLSERLQHALEPLAADESELARAA
jgi:exodeoxyribonuclease V alpha subunit